MFVLGIDPGVSRCGYACLETTPRGPRAVAIGVLRTAPSDPLPWPFPEPTIHAPSVFLPLALRPEEWRAPSGELVFGWSIEG